MSEIRVVLNESEMMKFQEVKKFVAIKENADTVRYLVTSFYEKIRFSEKVQPEKKGESQ
jgi:hypothetical protein